VVGDIKGFADRSLRDGLLDGVVNHYAKEAVLAYVRGDVPARQLARVERDLASAYDKTLPRCWNLLSGHDTARLHDVVGDRTRVKLATLLGYLLPGAAHVLCGEEVGVTTSNMTWDESAWDHELLALHRQLGALRKSHAALQSGELVDLTPEGEDDVLAFARVTRDPRETVIVVVNRADRPHTRILFAPMSDLPDGLRLKDALGGPGTTVHAGTLRLDVEAQSARVLCPDDDDEVGARFFRGY
jgi:glycosidase